MTPRSLKLLWCSLPPVQNNRCLNLICPSSVKTQCLFSVVGLTMETIYILFYNSIYSIMMMSLFTLSLPSSSLLSSDLCPGVELHTTDERFIYQTALSCTIPCPAEFILRWATFVTKAAWSQFVSVLGGYICLNSLPVLLGPNYLWSWQYGIACLVLNAIITIKALLSWLERQQEFWLVKNSIDCPGWSLGSSSEHMRPLGKVLFQYFFPVLIGEIC